MATPASNTNRNDARGGFTLLEILITLAIVGLLASIVTAHYGGVTQAERLRTASRVLAGMSDYIRSQAAGTKRNCYFDIDFDRNRYRFRLDPPTDAYGRFVDPEDEEAPLLDEDIAAWNDVFPWDTLPSGVYFRKLWISDQHFYDKGSIEVCYKPTGTLSSFILWLQATSDDQGKAGLWYSVSVNGLTGKSEVLDDKLVFAHAEESDFRQVMGSELPGAGGK